MSRDIHASAIVHPKAVLGENVKVGPFTTIGEHVILGDGCEVGSHVVLEGRTEFKNNVKIFPFCVIGAEPQHLKYRGEPTKVIVGNRVILRESVTIHRGTDFGNKETVIGDDSFLMAYTHVAHDCIVGKNVIIANGTQLAGHVTIEDNVFLGGMSAVTQFTRVGRYCYVGGVSTLRKDLPPFLLGKGNDFEVQGVNQVGLTRNGFSPETILSIKRLYKIFYLQNLTTSEAEDKILTEIGETDEVKVFLDFIRTTHSGITR